MSSQLHFDPSKAFLDVKIHFWIIFFRKIYFCKIAFVGYTFSIHFLKIHFWVVNTSIYTNWSFLCSEERGKHCFHSTVEYKFIHLNMNQNAMFPNDCWMNLQKVICYWLETTLGNLCLPNCTSIPRMLFSMLRYNFTCSFVKYTFVKLLL